MHENHFACSGKTTVSLLRKTNTCSVFLFKEGVLSGKATIRITKQIMPYTQRKKCYSIKHKLCMSGIYWKKIASLFDKEKLSPIPFEQVTRHKRFGFTVSIWVQ